MAPELTNTHRTTINENQARSANCFLQYHAFNLPIQHGFPEMSNFPQVQGNQKLRGGMLLYAAQGILPDLSRL
jgi:hypothetical protein